MNRARCCVPIIMALCILLLPPASLRLTAGERGRTGIRPEAVVRSPTFHQKVEGFPLALSPGEMEALLDDLPYASFLMRKYRIHTITISLDGDGYAAEDGKGIKGSFRLIERSGSFREYAGGGTIEHSLAGRISAEVVATIRYTPAGPALVKNDLEFWVLVNNPLLDLLCRLFKPLVASALRDNVEFLVLTVQLLAVAVRANGVEMLPP